MYKSQQRENPGPQPTLGRIINKQLQFALLFPKLMKNVFIHSEMKCPVRLWQRKCHCEVHKRGPAFILSRAVEGKQGSKTSESEQRRGWGRTKAIHWSWSQERLLRYVMSQPRPKQGKRWKKWTNIPQEDQEQRLEAWESTSTYLETQKEVCHKAESL